MSKSGINQANIDSSVRPQDDLYRHVNGTWLAKEVIPEDRPLSGSFTALRDDAEIAVRNIIEAASKSSQDAATVEGKIGALYADFMDEEAVEAAGISPITEQLSDIAAAKSIADVVSIMGELDKNGSDGLFGAYVNNDAGNPERSVLHLYQGGLGLPDESFYREESYAEIRAAYVPHIELMLTLAGLPDASERATSIMALETTIATHHWDKVTLRDPQKTYNLYDRADAIALLPAVELWLDALGVTHEQSAELVVSTPEFFTGVKSLLTETRLEDWKAWLQWRTISAAAPYLAAAFVQANFDFYGTVLSGTPAMRDRWKRGVGLVENAMGEAVGQLYVAEHFPAENKERMELLVANLIEAYRKSISALDWMSPPTIEKALTKLDSFTPKIGYPNKWRDYSALTVVPGDLMGNIARTSSFELNRQLAKIGAPIDRDEWLMTPQTVNAYYNPTMNEIVFPAAILQPPFFDSEADDAANYGGIGAVIGHEIGHGFDDQGSQFDGSGELKNWWTDEDRAAFTKLTARLVEQYNALSPADAPDHHVNGELTLGENIGDLGGLSISFLAFQLSLDGAEAPVLDGLSASQRFFFSWAECWRTKIRPEEAARRIALDPHSPNEFRCNAVVKNLDVFHESFGTAEGDELWLNPEDRVKIW